jgi:hypothetical protein
MVCPFVERSYDEIVDIATPYGFSGFAGNGAFFNFSENWNRFAVGRGYISGYINQHPLFTRLDDLRFDTVYRQKTLYIMNLTRGLEELFDNCSRSRRRALHRWEDLVTIVTDRTELTTFLLENHQDFYQRKNASSVYEFTPETITYLLSRENVVAIGAGRGPQLEAVNVFAYTEHAAEGIFNLSLPQGSYHGAGLIWMAAKHLVDIGIPAFNLGGGIIEDDSLARFKRSLGAEPFPLYALKQVYANESYRQACLCSHVDPIDRDGYFPNYRASNAYRDD